MKKLFVTLTAVTFGMLFTACSEDTMDKINENKNNPTEMGAKFILTDVMTGTAFNVVGSDLAFYTSCYIEHNVGVFNQLYNAEIRGAEPTVSSTYNNQWSEIYRYLYYLKVCIEKCSDGGSETGNYYSLGIAQVMTAYNLAILTDLFGDVPWSEALRPGVIYTPKVDSQESIYTEVFKYLDDAIENFDKDCNFEIGDQDLYYAGDIDLWKKFAFGLKARYTMRLMNTVSDKDKAMNSVLEFAEKSFVSADEEAKFNYYDGVNTTSPFYQFFNDRNYLGASKSFDDLLLSKNDPRESVFFKSYPGTDEFVLATNGKPTQQQGVYAISAISTPTAPTFLLSFHELEFLKAEAYARLGNVEESKSACESAVLAACNKVNVAISDSAVSEYVNKYVMAVMNNAASALHEVQVQKYIAFYEEEAVEAYNDIRRWRALGEEPITFAHVSPQEFPLRLTYGGDDVTTNPNVYDAFEAIDIYNDNVWWAGGTR